jgi:tetratricopeptide (TPR) repeat protein
MYASDFETAVKEARQVIQQNAKFAKAYLPLAIGALAAGDVSAARAAYEQMSGTGSFGASIATMGLADIAMYQGAFTDAEGILKAGIAEDEKTQNTAGLAAKTAALAEVLAAEGKTRPALDAVKRALEIAKDETVMVPAARVLTRFGRQAEAAPLASALDSQLQPERRAYAKIIEGEIALKQGNPAEAVEAFRAAQKLKDVWLGRFGLGVAYVSAGHYPEGLAELELAQKRRGEATAIFLDDIPSFRYLAPLPYWLARAQEGLGMKPAAAQNYNAYIALREKARNDPLAADARRRVAGL